MKHQTSIVYECMYNAAIAKDPTTYMIVESCYPLLHMCIWHVQHYTHIPLS